MTFEQAMDAVYIDLKETMIKRQQKYGSGNINQFGEMGVVVRLGDKFNRLKTRYMDHETPPEFDDESVDDTWVDVANYAIIALMIRKKIWGLPLEQDRSRSLDAEVFPKNGFC